MRTPQYTFWFKEGPLQLLSASFPKERLALMAIFGLAVLFIFIRSRQPLRMFWRDKITQDQVFKVSIGAFMYAFLMLVGFSLLLIRFKILENTEYLSNQISNRYFIGLAPIAIIATTLISLYLVRMTQHAVWQKLIMAGLGILLLLRLYKTIYGVII